MQPAVFVCLSLFIAPVIAKVDADRITNLPGYVGNLPSTHYSGYLDTGNATGSPGKLHYWLIEAESDPENAPIVLWLNGGPGSSSLIGLFTENGQIALNDDSLTNRTKEGIPQLFYNPYSWSRVANMLYLEQPKGVGFSYCTNNLRKRSGPRRECLNNDETTAIDAHEALVNFFRLYPEYSSTNFFITGESYAGVYIPMLMDQILKQRVIRNFKAAAIGNGCWGSACFDGISTSEINYKVFSGHAMISQNLSETIEAECGDFSSPSDKCSDALDEMNSQISDFNIYNIYDVCNTDQGSHRMQNVIRMMQQNFTFQSRPSDSFSPHPKLKGGLNDFKCGGQTAMSEYLSEPSVQQAIHVNPNTGGQSYTQSAGDLRPLYHKLFQIYRVMIYSGDVDACVPYWGTEKWTRGMNFTIEHDWHAWTSDTVEKKGKVVAGYSIKYNNMTLTTIKGAGHMVPTFKPAVALSMFRKFLADEPF